MNDLMHDWPAVDRSLLMRRTVQALWLTVVIAGCDLDGRTLAFTTGSLENGSAAGNTTAGSSPRGNDGGNAMQDGGAGEIPGASAGEANVGGGSSGGSAGTASGGAAGGASVGGSLGGGGSTSGGSTMTGGATSGGTSAGGANTSGSSTVGGGASGSSASAGSGGAPFNSPCGDLNRNRIDDCQETLAQNSRFNTDAGSWEAETLLQQRWDPTNATGGSSSGSLLVSNVNVIDNLGGSTTVGSRQCVRAWTGQHFDVGARVFIKSGQGSGKAAVNLLIFAGDGCSGTFIEGQTVDMVSEVDEWRVIEGEVAIPAGARSMYVRLVATKPFAQKSLDVLFDDVLVSEKK